MAALPAIFRRLPALPACGAGLGRVFDFPLNRQSCCRHCGIGRHAQKFDHNTVHRGAHAAFKLNKRPHARRGFGEKSCGSPEPLAVVGFMPGNAGPEPRDDLRERETGAAGMRRLSDSPEGNRAQRVAASRAALALIPSSGQETGESRIFQLPDRSSLEPQRQKPVQAAAFFTTVFLLFGSRCVRIQPLCKKTRRGSNVNAPRPAAASRGSADAAE